MGRTIDRVLAIAAKNNLNQTQLAELLDRSDQDITNWKARGMPARLIPYVADKLGVSIEEIHGRPTPANGVVDPRRITADSPQERTLLFDFRNMQQAEREALLLVASALTLRTAKVRKNHPYKKAKKPLEP